MNDRMRVIKRIDALVFKYLKLTRGERCQICGLNRGNLGPFHILPKSTYPRLRFSEANLLLACWQPCHATWHHDYHKAREIEERIKQIVGHEYELDLKVMNKYLPRLTMFTLMTLEIAWKKKLEMEDK